MKIKILAFVLVLIALRFFVAPDTFAQGTIPDEQLYLPLVSHIPATATPTPIPTATATPTATPTRDPDVPFPHDHAPGNVAIQASDVPNGWIIESDGYQDISKDEPWKHIISAYYSFFWTRQQHRVVSVESEVVKYLTSVDASGGFERGKQFWLDKGYSLINMPAVSGADESVYLWFGNSDYIWTLNIVRVGNIRIETTNAWVTTDYDYTLTTNCTLLQESRIITLPAVTCNLSDYTQVSAASHDNPAPPIEAGLTVR